MYHSHLHPQVTDGRSEHERMTIYWITVQDLNDVPPQFDRAAGTYEVQLPENREVGKPTGIRLAFIDPDIGGWRLFLNYCVIIILSLAVSHL